MAAATTFLPLSLIFPSSCSSRLAVKSHAKRLPESKKERKNPRASLSSDEVLMISSEKQKRMNSQEGFRGMGIVSEACSFTAYLAGSALRMLKPPCIQIRVEKSIINCRFFTLIGILGTLLGSILCFTEGCFLVLETYLNYFLAISKKLDHGDIMQLMIEAIDMFLVGSAMLVFGMGMYAMFIGSRGLIRGQEDHGSNHFGPSHSKVDQVSDHNLPAFSEMKSVSQAKSRIGHAVLILLQAGTMEKFENVPLETGLDLACFAGAILVSSACLFLLSHIHCKHSNFIGAGVAAF